MLEHTPITLDFKTQLIKNSFYFTYVFLITTGTITFIEAIRTTDPIIRHIMNLETCISIIAAFFYSQFLETIKDAEKNDAPIPFDIINLTRYTDWFISTPFMLFVLCMVLANESKTKYMFSSFVIVLVLNYAMLGVGYMGETRQLNRNTACFIGFAFFAIMFGYIWITFMRSRTKSFGSLLSFYLFLVVWALYGLVYLFDEKTKNIMFNGLDLMAKAIVGIFFWVYFTGAAVL